MGLTQSQTLDDAKSDPGWHKVKSITQVTWSLAWAVHTHQRKKHLPKKLVECRERGQSLGWKNVSWQADFKSDTRKKKIEKLTKWTAKAIKDTWVMRPSWGWMGLMQSQNPRVDAKSNPGRRKVKSINQATRSLAWAGPYSPENESSPEKEVERRVIRLKGGELEKEWGGCD